MRLFSCCALGLLTVATHATIVVGGLGSEREFAAGFLANNPIAGMKPERVHIRVEAIEDQLLADAIRKGAATRDIYLLVDRPTEPVLRLSSLNLKKLHIRWTLPKDAGLKGSRYSQAMIVGDGYVSWYGPKVWREGAYAKDAEMICERGMSWQSSPKNAREFLKDFKRARPLSDPTTLKADNVKFAADPEGGLGLASSHMILSNGDTQVSARLFAVKPFSAEELEIARRGRSTAAKAWSDANPGKVRCGVVSPFMTWHLGWMLVPDGKKAEITFSVLGKDKDGALVVDCELIPGVKMSQWLLEFGYAKLDPTVKDPALKALAAKAIQSRAGHWRWLLESAPPAAAIRKW